MTENSSDSLPIALQWIGFVLTAFSAAGLLLVIPTLLQLFFGGPKLVETFDSEDDAEGNRLLVVFTQNEPVNKPIGQFSLVRREVVSSFSATFRIIDLKTGSVVVPVHQAPIHSGDDADDNLRRYSIPLPPTLSIGATIGVAMWISKLQMVAVPSTRRKSPVPLPASKYQLQIIYSVDGRRHDVAKDFVVGSTREELAWE